ncbi:MAG: DNA-directed RNA polymerase subunit H [Thermoprotei archaeon]|nr:MAG: DNA-directed RNA polymerase subunit H [Thermoprotei archaeon]RLE70114.1 MAG: DNA-directed RNA polymerase subunit H [Thermoprotei archaeon]
MPKKFDIFKNELVPKHILLKRDEAEIILRRMNIRKNQLPWILSSDPAVRALNAKPGDIIMIIRKSPTAGTSIALRVVIPGSIYEY